MLMRIMIPVILGLIIGACSDDHEGVSHSLQAQLKNTIVDFEFLKNSKFSEGYWVREELDGWGLLVITKNNEPNSYTLALMAHGHERALESRVIDCK